MLGVAVVVTSLTVGVLAVVVVAATRTSSTSVAEQGINEIRISGATGGASIQTQTRTDGRVSGTARATTTWQEAEVTSVRDGDVLLLTARCPDGGWPGRCDVSYTLVVDPDTDVVVDIGTGGLQADGLAGDVSVSITAGGVLLTDLRSDDVEAAVTTGGVAMEFSESPTQVLASTTTGGVSITLPDDGLAYDVRTAVSVGDSSVRVPTDPDSPRSIDATTTVGGIDIGREVIE